ncbi:Hypothetical protein CINCED_3A004432 [Cinara cedri]|uniref:Uncharacterized protein n=1 Tax=Cinara cedri TaxID=506608 RepID=A0A5E4NGJ8_9HEMI|nr:Hypothetical protein CINCED_3A004432 [Cinara cedri]
MYKSTYQKDFIPSVQILDSDSTSRRIEPVYAVIPELDEDGLKQMYTPKIIFRALSDNKGIEPPLEYAKRDLDPLITDDRKRWISLYKDSYTLRAAANEKEETLEEWALKLKKKICNVPYAEDLVQQLSNQLSPGT